MHDNTPPHNTVAVVPKLGLSTMEKAQSPSDAFMKTSRRHLSKASIFVADAPLGFEETGWENSSQGRGCVILSPV